MVSGQAPLVAVLEFHNHVPGVDPNAGSVFVNVNVVSMDPRFLVRDWEPRSISVLLDPFSKKIVPVRGTTVQIEYGSVERERDVDGETRNVKVPLARALKVVAGGKATTLKLEPPNRELIAPEADKKLMVVARSLDLRGESLTGTRMDFCVLSYSTLVECGESPEHQVVQIEFPQ